MKKSMKINAMSMAVLIAMTPVIASANDTSGIIAGTRNISVGTPATQPQGTTGTATTSTTDTTGGTTQAIPHPSVDSHGCEQTVWVNQTEQARQEVIMKNAQIMNPTVMIEDMKKHPSAGQCLAGVQEIMDISIHMPQIGGSLQGIIKKQVIEQVKKMIITQQKAIMERVCQVADSALRSAFGGIITTIEDINKITHGLENADEAVGAVIGHQVGKFGDKVTGSIYKQIDRLDDQLQEGSKKFSDVTSLQNKELDKIVKEAENINQYDDGEDEGGGSVRIGDTDVAKKAQQKAEEVDKKAVEIRDNGQKTADKVTGSLPIGNTPDTPKGAMTTVPSNTQPTQSAPVGQTAPATNTGANTGATTQPVQPTTPAQSQPRVAGTTTIQ